MAAVEEHDDGYDVVLLVSAAPGTQHQVAAGNLNMLLRTGCPPDLQVLFAPVDVAWRKTPC